MRRPAPTDYVHQSTVKLRLLLWTSVALFGGIVPLATWRLWIGGRMSLLTMCAIISSSLSLALAMHIGHYTGFWKAFLTRKVGAALVTLPPYTYAHREEDPPLRLREVLLMYQRRHPFRHKWIFPAAVCARQDRDLRHTAARVAERTAGVPAVAEEEVFSYRALSGADSAFAFEVSIYATILETKPSTLLEDGRWMIVQDVTNTPDPSGPEIAPRFVRILRELVDRDEEERRRANRTR